MHHAALMAHYREHDKRGMRRYLTEVGDEEALRSWDKEMMRSSTKKSGR